MVLMTMIGRISDGLPLTASIQDDEIVGRNIVTYQTQAKNLFRKINANSPEQMSIETDSFYLDDIQKQFQQNYMTRLNSVSRPYCFIEFDNYIQKAKKNFTDSRSRRNLNQLNTELQDVQKIMVQNIDDVLQRGIAITDLDNKATNLSILSQKYKKDARYLNLRATYAKLAAGCLVIFVVFLYFWVL
ncbi:vesicle-trafficking protein SEC22b-A-like protein [Sarcoptes scabiei]|uniref:Vesicle-trafficking protein SEC22b-A-like protein n=1 Tax=Sarcoptes scabiei TaxID=52283 RepID=A0A132A340_SARSC|nr:vesicle-trafficking protein SEC22b-A-like protein [Sarcoptes scabiei]